MLAIHNTQATHIVGGDLQLVYTGQDNYYKVNMKMYFDDIHADPSLLYDDLTIHPSVYRKVDNAFITNVELTRDNIDFIENGTGCSDMSIIRTRLLTFNGFINLENYTDLNGYYIVWERCCRNNAIVNINNPDNTGEVFYLEFPPVFLNNTTPYFKPLTNQYWCKGVNQYLDFSGVDPNGDELRYEMTDPLAGHSDGSQYNSSPNYPYISATASAPYSTVFWLAGYGKNAQIQGNTPLQVNATTGMLLFNANQNGLYVFSVKVSEYRRGIKIGESNREFQILIQDCPINYPPQIALNKSFGNGVGQIELFLNEVKSVDLFLADATTTTLMDTDNITLVGIVSNLNSSIFSLNTSTALFPGRDTVQTQLVINPCGYLKINTETTERVQIIVRDDRCPTMYDTLLLDIKFKIPINSPPILDILPNVGNHYNLYPGESIRFLVQGTDTDITDKLNLTAIGHGFELQDYNMNFQNVSGTALVSSPFSWTADCERAGAGPLRITFKVKDNSCVTSHETTQDVWLNVIDKVSNVEQYKPVNLVTANDDGLNDSFFMANPPLENCDYYFKSISIYNAWGARVFYNTSKDFVWKPEHFTKDGIYYYYFDFNKKEIKGWLQVVSGGL